MKIHYIDFNIIIELPSETVSSTYKEEIRELPGRETFKFIF